MPFSHRLSRAWLSAAILAALMVGGYLGYRHGTVAVQLTHWFVTTVKRIWR